MLNPTVEEVEALPATKSYIKFVREEVLCWEVENFTKNVPKMGIRNLSLFFQIVGLDEKYCRAEIKKADELNNKSIIISGWKISWRSIDDVYTLFRKLGVATTPRTKKITGKVKINKKDFDPGDYELNKLVERFMI